MTAVETTTVRLRGVEKVLATKVFERATTDDALGRIMGGTDEHDVPSVLAAGLWSR